MKKLKLVAIISLSWLIWFLTKLAICNDNVYVDISDRFLDAIHYSRNAIVFSFLAIYTWGNVILPFVRDLAFVVSQYLVPNLYRFVLLPAVPICRFAFAKILLLNEWVPFEYKLGSGLFAILLFNKRISSYWKVFIIALIANLVMYNYFGSLLLANPLMVNLVFHIVPVGLFFSSPPRKKLHSNLLFLFTISPIFLYFDSMVVTCVCWAWIASFYYFLNSQEIVANYFWRSKNPFEKLQRKLSLLGERIVDFGLSKFPHPVRLYRVVQSLASSKLALVCLAIGALIFVYYAFSSLSRLLTLLVWPWFFSECGRTLLYRRAEDYESQLSFALLFLGFELFILPNKWIGWFASLLHLPLLFLLKLAPVVILSGFRKSIVRLTFTKTKKTS